MNLTGGRQQWGFWGTGVLPVNQIQFLLFSTISERVRELFMVNGMKQKGRQRAISFGWPFPGSLRHWWLRGTNTWKSSARSLFWRLCNQPATPVNWTHLFALVAYTSGNIGTILCCILAFVGTSLLFFLTYMILILDVLKFGWTEEIPARYYLALRKAWRRNRGAKSTESTIESKWERRHRGKLLLCRLGGTFIISGHAGRNGCLGRGKQTHRRNPVRAWHPIALLLHVAMLCPSPWGQ